MRRALPFAAVFAAALVAGVQAAADGDPGYAGAGPTDGHRTYVIPAAGTLSIAVQASASLGTGKTTDSSISGGLGNVVVMDTRTGIGLKWNASATTTSFVGPGGSPLTAVTYNAGLFGTTGGLTMVLALPVSLTASPKVVATTLLDPGGTTCTWNPTLTVGLPTNPIAGSYTGTVNTSVA